MTLQEKIIKELKKHLGDTFPDTFKKYEEMINMMEEKEIIDTFINKKQRVRLYVKDRQDTQKRVDKLMNSLGVSISEKLILPYKANTKTKYKMITFPMQVLKLQQMASKENASTIDTTMRDMNNQATRHSKTGILSDAEVAQMVIYGDDADVIVKELFSPRGDNKIAKAAMNEQLKDNLEFSLESIPLSGEGRISLYHLDANYACMGLATDLIDHIDERS